MGLLPILCAVYSFLLVIVVTAEAPRASRGGRAHAKHLTQSAIVDASQTGHRIPPCRRGKAGSPRQVHVLILAMILEFLVVRIIVPVPQRSGRQQLPCVGIGRRLECGFERGLTYRSE